MKSLKHLLKLFKLALTARRRDGQALLYILRHYFSCLPFMFAWCWLKTSYLMANPYLCSRRYAQGQDNPDEWLYGEIPLPELEKVMTAAAVTDQDYVFELGAGAGFTSLWLSSFLKCQVTAVERVPVFCWRLGRTARRFNLAIDVRCESFLETDFSGASVIYLYGSALGESTIIALVIKLSRLPLGTKVISVSYGLSEFDDTASFQLISSLTVSFDWGEADVFVQEVC